MNEAIRKCRFNLEVGDELASRALLEWEFFNYRDFLPLGDSLKSQMVMRKIFSRFNSEEIREILAQRYFLKTLDAKLAEKGLKIPESEQEADEILKI